MDQRRADLRTPAALGRVDVPFGYGLDLTPSPFPGKEGASGLTSRPPLHLVERGWIPAFAGMTEKCQQRRDLAGTGWPTPTPTV